MSFNKFHEKNYEPPPFSELKETEEDNKSFSSTNEIIMETKNPLKEEDNRFRWSFDISNVEKHYEGEFIFIAISRIDVEENMKRIREDGKNEKLKCNKIKMNKQEKPINYGSSSGSAAIAIPPKGIAIHCFKLTDETANKSVNAVNAVNVKFIRTYYSNHLSGICRFVEEDNPVSKSNGSNSISENDPDHILKRFILLNFNGIYNFKYHPEYMSFNSNKRFSYPNIFDNELENRHTKEDLPNCMNRLLSCIYGRYFLVENAKFLEGE